MAGILWTIAVVLIVLWLIGFIIHFAGSFIHLLLIIALVVILYNLFMGSRARRTL